MQNDNCTYHELLVSKSNGEAAIERYSEVVGVVALVGDDMLE